MSPQLNKADSCKKVKVESNEFYQAKEYNKEHSRSYESKDSRVSKWNREKRISDVFEAALKTNYYPVRLKIIYGLFYLLLLGIMVGLIFFKLNLEDNTRNLEAIKEIVSNSEAKSIGMLTTQLTSLLIWSITTGKINVLDLGSYSAPLTFYVQNLRVYLVTVANINSKVLLGMNQFLIEGKGNLFSKDVRVFDSYYDDPQQVFTVMNILQATDRYVEVGLKGVAKLQKNVTSGREEILFLLRNSANDLMIKNEAISDSFMESLAQKKEQINDLIAFCLIIAISLSLLKTVIFFVIIWKQYFNDKYVILSLTKLSSQKLNGMREQIYNFVDAIENSKEINVKNSTENKNMKEIGIKDSWKVDAKKQNYKKPRLGQKQRRYSLYAANFFCFIMVLIASIVAICLPSRNSIQLIQTRQNQLYFIQRLRSNLLLTATMSQELITGNGTTLNHNIPISEQLVKSMNQLAIMRNRIPSVLMNNDLTYDYGVDSILFSDGCFMLEGSQKSACERVEITSTKTNLINVLSMFEAQIAERKENFDISDKSSLSLSGLESNNLERVFTFLSIISAQCEVISSRINQGFEEDLATSRTQLNLSFWLFCGYLVVYGFLLWIIFLKNFKEINNHLKKTLQNFPANLILSNFTLKIFLNQVSKNVLEMVKNDI